MHQQRAEDARMIERLSRTVTNLQFQLDEIAQRNEKLQKEKTVWMKEMKEIHFKWQEEIVSSSKFRHLSQEYPELEKKNSNFRETHSWF